MTVAEHVGGVKPLWRRVCLADRTLARTEKAPIVLKISALPCYSVTPLGGIAPLTHDDETGYQTPAAFGDYRVMHQLGVGVLGPVFRGYPPDGDYLVALKAFHLELLPEQAGEFADALAEVVALGPLHPSLVRPLGSGVADGVPFLAYEYVAAESLDVAVRGQLSATVDVAVPLTLQLAEAFDAAHARGLCHGSLHPRDIFVTPDLIRVGGFGIQRLLEDVGLRGALRRPFAAPEQVAAEQWGAAADRFALAAVTYEVLTGRRASGADSQLPDAFGGIADGRYSSALSQVFVSALAEDPTVRPGSARLFAEQLAEAVEWNGGGRVLGPVGMNRSEVDSDSDEKREPSVVDGGGVEYDSVWAAASRGGIVMPKNEDRTGKLEPGPDAEVAWNERSLDRGIPDEFQQSEGYEPRPVGAPPGFERPEAREQDSNSNTERQDLALGEGDAGYLSALDAIGDRPTVKDIPVVPEEERDSSALITDTSLDGDQDQEFVDTSANDGSLSKPFDEPELAPDSGQRRDAFEFGPIEEVTTELPITVYEDSLGDPGHSEPAGLDASGLEAIQARYRPGDSGEAGNVVVDEPEGVVPYEPIALRDLEERLGSNSAESRETHARDEARVDDADQVGVDSDDDYVPEGGDRLEPSSFSESAIEPNLDNERFPLLADDGYDYVPAADVQGVSTDELVEHSRDSWARRLPPAVIVGSVILAFGAFGMGFRWMAGSDASSVDDVLPVEPVASGSAATSIDTEGVLAVGEFGEVLSADLPESLAMGEPLIDVARESAAEGLTLTPSSLPEPQSVGEVNSPDPVDDNEQVLPSLDGPPGVSVPVGRLLVRSMPPGARVELDGELRGTTPLALSGLAYGDYSLRVGLEGYKPRDRQVLIASGDPIVAFSVELERQVMPVAVQVEVGSISVDTRPVGVQVWLDQRLVGETPMLISGVTAGAHVVEFRHTGYRDWSTTVRVDPSEQARVTASLDHARP